MTAAPSKTFVLIPAYKPAPSMLALVDALGSYDGVVVVDDGSGPDYSQVFDDARSKGCIVLTHDENLGKGRALKTGIRHIRQTQADANVITADADGQHLPEDIDKIRTAMESAPDMLIIGSRAFAGDIPLRSKVGNSITRRVFSYATGNDVSDTQTGLRGLPFSSLEKLLELPGDRYEFEIEMLLHSAGLGLRILEIPITTVYIGKNETSHFNTVVDSWRIYKRIILYSASSLLSAGVDVGIFSLLSAWKMKLLPAIVIARLCSLLVNYLLNSTMVFSHKRTKLNLLLYVLLACVILALNYYVTLILSYIMSIYIAKIVANFLLFFISYGVQKSLIFKHSG